MLPLAIEQPRHGEYLRTAAVLDFAVAGDPIAQGSKTFRGKRRDGSAILAESSKHLKPWRDQVIDVARAVVNQTTPPADGWPLIGPVAVELVFTMRKPRSAPKGRRTWPTVMPDVDKTARAILDALTYAGAWGDDSQVVDLHAFKVYPAETPRALRVPGVRITVYRVQP